MPSPETLPGQVLEHESEGSVKAMLQNITIDKLDDSVKNWLNDQNAQTLEGAVAFVPWILQQAFFQKELDEKQIVIHKGTGGVVFSDASGFTALTEKLARKSNGAELLSQCLSSFFTPLIDLINAYRGDTIKFSGDALTIYFPSVDDTKCPAYNGIVPPHGSFGLSDCGPMATAVLRASACCIEIHKRLHMFETGVDDVRLCLHIGIGCGDIQILQVGGVVPPETHVPRMEYLISGSPLEQISIAEPLAKNGETCLSPQAWDLVKECVVEGRPLEDRMDFHLLNKMDESKYTFPTVKYATQLYDLRYEHAFSTQELEITRRYIPSAVYKQIECGTLQYVNEMRNISVIFISGSNLDVMSPDGPKKAQELMSSVQKVCYAHEGTLNKFLIDDKGMLFLLVFGLPPLVHPDDPTRAVLATMELVQVFRSLDLIGRFGITTGRSYCGVCGSAKRMEYTVLGDCVNLAARIMTRAEALGALSDEETSKHCSGEVLFKALDPVEVKGKSKPIPIFKPIVKEATTSIGLTVERKIRFPWYDNPLDGSNLTSRDPVRACKEKVQHLCSIQKWAPGVKVAQILGGPFNKIIHSTEQTVGSSSSTRVKPPPGSPFAEGGLVVMEGAAGLGKIELAEHIVTHCAMQFQMLPVFGTMGPRPGESNRMALELLRSSINIFRNLSTNTPAEDVQALEKLAPLHYNVQLAELLRGRIQSVSSDVMDLALKAVLALLQKLAKDKTGVLVVLQFEHGTSLFDKTMQADVNVFWKVTSALSQLIAKEKSIAGLVLCREADREQVCVQEAIRTDNLLTLKGLNDEIIEYMANYLQIPENTVPPPLRKFVKEVTMGNPLYIRETLDQLMEEQHLKVKPGTSATLGVGALNDIDIAAWNHTAMIGGTVCNIESLDPIETAALKMSTCFEGPFALPDLAASNCSQWGGSTHFDLLRLYRATRRLVQRGFIEKVQPPSRESPRGSTNEKKPQFGDMQHFQMQSALVRTVGKSMVLEAQRKSVKRNALIDRVLKQELPERLSELSKEKGVQHIPWYYERALRRMLN